MKIELLHISAVKETQYFSYIDLNLNMYIPYNFIHLMRKSPWDLRGGNLEQQNIFSFQFTYTADSKKTRAFSVAPPWIWTDAERNCMARSIAVYWDLSKKMLPGDRNFAFWTASQNLTLTSLPALPQVENLFQDYWSTVHWFLYCKSVTALDCSSSKGYSHSSEPVVSLRKNSKQSQDVPHFSCPGNPFTTMQHRQPLEQNRFQ